MTAKNRIEEIKRNGYDLDFGEVFNRSIEIYKKIALNAGIVFILFSLVMGATVLGFMGAFWGFGSLTQTMTDFNMGNLSILAILLYVIAVAVIGGLVSPFTAGIIKMAHCAAIGEDFSISTAFDYYKGGYFKDLFLSTVVITIFSGGISGVLESMGIVLVGTLISYAVSFFTFLTIPLIIFGNLKAFEAIQGSFIIVSRKIFVLLALLIVAVIVAGLGIIGFCIGIFFTFPFIYATFYCVYEEVVGIEHKNELDEIGTETE